MTYPSNTRETGTVLLISITFTLLMFGLVTAMVVSSTTTSRAVSESSDQVAALYAAQTGLAQAKQELARSVDTASDGLGTVAGETQGGSFQVLGTELGDNLLQLDAIGTVRTGSASLREIVELAPSLIFPRGAMSILGSADRSKIMIKKDLALVLDGGDSPAIAISDPDLFDGLAEEFVAAIERGTLPLENLTGGVTTPMEINGVTEDVPIVNVPEYAAVAETLDEFYDQLVAGVRNLIPAATAVGGLITSGNEQLTFGTPENPVVVHFDSPIFLHGNDEIIGHGVLIVSKELRLGRGTKLTWNGDVIAMGDSNGEADIRVSGDFTVNGNVVVLGEGGKSSWLRIGQNTGAKATINGSFFASTGFDPHKGKKASIRNAGELVVNGLMMLLGSKIDVRTERGSDLIVNGMTVLAIRDNPNRDDLSLRFDGGIEMHKDEAQIQAAINSIIEMGARLNLDSIPILKFSVESRAWMQNYEGNHEGNRVSAR